MMCTEIEVCGEGERGVGLDYTLMVDSLLTGRFLL